MTNQMTFFDIGLIPVDSWQYDEDNGNVMCRCPVCEGRLLIGVYTYHNPYKFCPYCGEKLAEGRIKEKRKQVYRLAQEKRYDGGRD